MTDDIVAVDAVCRPWHIKGEPVLAVIEKAIVIRLERVVVVAANNIVAIDATCHRPSRRWGIEFGPVLAVIEKVLISYDFAAGDTVSDLIDCGPGSGHCKGCYSKNKRCKGDFYNCVFHF